MVTWRIVGERHYPNKPIGTSLAGVPLYYAGALMADYYIPKTNKIMAYQLSNKDNYLARMPRIDDSGVKNLLLAGSFIATDENLEKVQIFVAKEGKPPTSLVVKITKNKNDQPSSEPDVGKAQIIPSYRIKENRDLFTVPYPAKLEKGEKYWLVIQSFMQVAGTDGCYKVSRGTVPSEAGAEAAEPDNEWHNVSQAPFFKIYSSTTVEPSAAIITYQKDRITIFAVSLLATIASILSIFFIFKILYHIFKLSFSASWLAAIAFAFGTLNWKYSRLFFSHALSVFLVLLALYLFLSIVILKRKNIFPFVLLGLALGFTLFVDYTNMLFVAGVLIYFIMYYLWSRSYRQLFRNLIWVVLGLIPSVIGILLYQLNAFGSIFATSYKYYTAFPMFLDKSLWFTKSHFDNLITLLFVGVGNPESQIYHQSDEVFGVFYSAPFLILAFVGLYYLFKRTKSIALMILGVVIAIITFVSFFHCVYGGGSHDYRYALVACVLLIIPLGFFIDKIICQRLARSWNLWWHLVFLGLLYYSIGIHFQLTTYLQAHTGLVNLFLGIYLPFYNS